LLEFIVAQRIGLDVHGFVAVGLFGLAHARGAGKGGQQQDREEAFFHEARILHSL